MEIKDFLALETPDRYDFSNDGASEEYRELDNFKNDLKKFFVYMAKAREYKRTEEDIMKYGADFSQKYKGKKMCTLHPDSNSILLEEIYEKLWSDSYLEFCRKTQKSYIQGDVMNSVNTTLGEWYKLVEDKTHQEERSKLGRQAVSIRYILSRYAQDAHGQSKLFDTVEELRFFISIYHTLGNFIPVPAGCNGPRGTGELKDYWDLTLKIIYDYYVCEEDKVRNIVGEKNSELYELYKQWLNSFQDDGKPSWQCFIEKNYLQDFVNQNEDGSYGKPKELWRGHFSDFFSGKKGALPYRIEQIEQFCGNASCFITARSTRMLTRLRALCQWDAERT